MKAKETASDEKDDIPAARRSIIYEHVFTHMSKMILNKYALLLEQFLEDYERRVHGRELTSTIPLSQKAIALSLRELEDLHVLVSEPKGTIKQYMLNRHNTSVPDLLAIAEMGRKLRFLDEHLFARPLSATSGMCVLHGSYAKAEQTRQSDLDILIIGSREKMPEHIMGIPLHPISLSEPEYVRMLQKKDRFAAGILINHIILSGAERYTRLAWRHWYGFD